MMQNLPQLEGDSVTLRPLAESDTHAIVAILQEPSVASWWHGYDEVRFAREYFEEGELAFVIEVDGKTAGLIQFDEENYPDYRYASIDLSLATAYQGRGYGGQAIRTLATYLFNERGHHRITIDPAAANEQAIAVYRKVGFKPVGVMRKYERDPGGGWRDGLLMDLLKDELQ